MGGWDYAIEAHTSGAGDARRWNLTECEPSGTPGRIARYQAKLDLFAPYSEQLEQAYIVLNSAIGFRGEFEAIAQG